MAQKKTGMAQKLAWRKKMRAYRTCSCSRFAAAAAAASNRGAVCVDLGRRGFFVDLDAHHVLQFASVGRTGPLLPEQVARQREANPVAKVVLIEPLAPAKKEGRRQTDG